MFWIKLLITLLDVYVIYSVADIFQYNIVTVTDVINDHEMHGKNIIAALFISLIIIFNAAMAFPLTHMLTGATPVNPILVGFMMVYMFYLYNLDLIDFPR